MNPYRRQRRPGPGRRGFTLVEMLVVVTIIVIVAAATIKVAVFDQGGRQVSEAARMVQAAVVGARDAAYRANAPRGFRLLPDPVLNGLNGNGLAANRMISIEAAPDYSQGLASATAVPTALPGATGLTGFLTFSEAVLTGTIPNEPTSWFWNIRQGDKIRFGDSGRYYTVAGPMTIGAYDTSGQTSNATGASSSSNPVAANVERYINNGPPGQWYVESTQTFVTHDPNPLNPPPKLGDPGHYPEFLRVVNGQDDDGDGWVDESFDGIDNDGDGIVDPAFNGVDDDGDSIIDNESELLFNGGGEYEPEQFIGNEFNSLNQSGLKDKPYVIVRRPVVAQGAREVALPQDVVIDLTTWNATGATPQPTLPERSRLPVDPYSFFVDVLLGPDGQVVVSTPGQSAGSGAGNMAFFPTSNMPFYHFWICERRDVYPPLFGMTNPVVKVGTATGGTTNVTVTAPQSQVPVSNPLNVAQASGSTTPPQVFLLPMPQGAVGEWIQPNGNGAAQAVSYAPPSGSTQTTANGPYLEGEMRLVTLFVKTGQVLTYDIGLSDFDPTDTNQPYMQAQFGVREAK